jgi:aconitate hydratase
MYNRDEGATYDKEIEIDLATIEPLIALPEAP